MCHKPLHVLGLVVCASALILGREPMVMRSHSSQGSSMGLTTAMPNSLMISPNKAALPFKTHRPPSMAYASASGKIYAIAQLSAITQLDAYRSSATVFGVGPGGHHLFFGKGAWVNLGGRSPCQHRRLRHLSADLNSVSRILSYDWAYFFDTDHNKYNGFKKGPTHPCSLFL